MKKIDPVLHERLATLISSMGCELVGYEMTMQGRQMVFRIYIDKEHGVTVDDCSQVSRQVGSMFDVEDAFQGRYNLEVSSPGIDRPLFELGHYQKYVGSQIKVKLHSPIEQRRQFKGTLTRVEGEDIYLLVDDTAQEVKLPYALIDKANLIGDVNM